MSSVNVNIKPFARSILAFANDTESLKLMPSETDVVTNKKAPRVLNYEKFSPEHAFAVYPNPSNGKMKLISYVDEIKANTKLVVSELTGRKIMEMDLETGKRLLEIELKGIVSGNYLLSVLENQQQVYQTKITIHE